MESDPAPEGNDIAKSQSDEKSESICDEFIWQDYMDATQTEPVLPFLFDHVEKGLQSCFKEGMKIEVPHKDNAELHWVADIISVYGSLLRLRYVGVNDDPSNIYWLDPAIHKVHRLGWCKDNGKPLIPPRSVSDASIAENPEEYLKGAETLSEEITGDGYTPVERLKQGMKVEVQDEKNPHFLWIATIIENVGGRLLLRYDSPVSNSPNFWLYYTSPRLFPIGFCEKHGHPLEFRRPSSIITSADVDDSKWNSILESSLEEGSNFSIPPDLIQIRVGTIKHDLTVGMKCEALHPKNRIEICPATVVKIFDEFYFLVVIDDLTLDDDGLLSSDLFWLGYIGHPYIFPIGWSKKANIELANPKKWISKSGKFNWSEYLSETNSAEAPISIEHACAQELGFEINLKLEAMNPENPNQICAATVTALKQHLLQIRLDSHDESQENHIITSYNSTDIFPVGWCDTNSYPLKPPRDSQDVLKNFKISYEEELKESTSSNSSTVNGPVSKAVPSLSGSSWCPKIYFNHKCFTGPFLSKTGLAKLPKAVGPGPVTLVLKEILSMLIGIAYLPNRVLKELQCLEKTPSTHVEVLKAKYKTALYRAEVEIVTSSDKVTSFCEDVCHRLQICPNLLSLAPLDGSPCPKKCHLMSKTNISTASVNPKQTRKTGEMRKIVKIEKSRNEYVPEVLTRRSLKKTRSRLNQLENSKESMEENVAPAKKTRYETRGVKLPSFAVRNKPRQKCEDELMVVGTPSQNKLPLPIKRGRKSHRRTENRDKLVKSLTIIQTIKDISNQEYIVPSNPYRWSVEDLYDYISETPDCHMLAPLLKSQEFDGISFMLLNLPSCVESLNLNYKMAIRLCRHVEAVKYTYLSKYKSSTSIETDVC